MLDITKEIDNFQGNEKELKNIAYTIYELTETVSYIEDMDFLNKCYSMLTYDYDYLNEKQKETVYNIIINIVNNEI